MNKTDYFKTMLTIRMFEEALCPYIDNNEIQTPCHLYIGQEAIATGICSQLNNDDLIWGNHRSHGHYIAKGGDIFRLMDEIFCKETGCSGGRGGSMHIIDKGKGIYGTVPIVAGTVPLSVGAGLSMKLENSKRVSVAFLGDGATEEGHVLESINFAMLYQLPVIFIIENNLYSSHMHMAERRKQEDLQKISNLYGLTSEKIDGNDVELVAKTMKDISSDVRNGKGPAIIECMTYRWRGHVGTSFDEDVGVKRKNELDQWLEKDPIEKERLRLLKSGINQDEINDIQISIDNNIQLVLQHAINASYPHSSTLMDHVFTGKLKG